MPNIVELVSPDGSITAIEKNVIERFKWFQTMMENETREISRNVFPIEADAFTCKKMIQWMNYETNNEIAPMTDPETNLYRELTHREEVFLADIGAEVIVDLTHSVHYYQLTNFEALLTVEITRLIQVHSVINVQTMFYITEDGFTANERMILRFESKNAERLLEN